MKSRIIEKQHNESYLIDTEDLRCIDLFWQILLHEKRFPSQKIKTASGIYCDRLGPGLWVEHPLNQQSFGVVFHHKYKGSVSDAFSKRRTRLAKLRTRFGKSVFFRRGAGELWYCGNIALLTFQKGGNRVGGAFS